MAKDFWFPFEPKLWLGDSDLRRCSAHARAVWIDVICHMHDMEEKGTMRTNGKAWKLEDIAEALQGDAKANLAALYELIDKGVASLASDGAMVCRHMHRRWEVSQKRSKAGIRGNEIRHGVANASQTPRKPPRKPLTITLNSDSERESAEREREPNPIWDAVIAHFPLDPKADAKRIGKAVRELKARGATADDIRTRVERYRATWPTAECSVEALVKHWVRFGEGYTPPAGQLPFAQPSARPGARQRSEDRGEYPEPRKPLPRL